MAGPGAPPPPPPRPAAGGSTRGGRARASKRRWRLSPRWRRILGIVAGVAAAGLAIVAAMVVYAAMTLPDINTIGRATGTIRILDSQGKLIAQVGHDQQNRHPVTIDQIAPILQKATIAAEDRSFYNEGAFNPVRVVKAFVDDVLLRRPAEGASTITQQLAKQAFFGADASKSPLRKIKEALLANQIDSRYTKQQILDQYLNITYYGENAYGIENASLRYFGKHASELTLPEAALLAGLPEAPSYNDPYQNPQAAWARMHYVLESLVVVGDITQAQADAVDPLAGGSNPTPAQQAQAQAAQAALHADLQNGKAGLDFGPAPHFVQYIEEQLQQAFGADNPQYLQGDLTVTTTLNLNYQRLADTAVAAGVAKLSSDGANNGALLMIDAHSGNIEAFVGSADFANDAIAGQYDIVTASRRPGSSFKPYVYETGFMNGTLKPDTILQDTRAESQKLGGVPDFDGRFLGPITAAKALLLSRNVATEQAMQMAGVQPVINLAYSLGICTCTPQAPNLSTAIGTSAVRMIDHASAYASFANGGHRVVARGILKVTDGSGNILLDDTQTPDHGTDMTPAEAWSITQILRHYPQQWNLRFKYPTAGKSGTTDNFVDAWYMSYTPDWVVATWTGHTSGTNPAEQGMNQVFGTSTGAAIAVPFVNSLPRPSGFVPASGALPDCASPDAALAATSGCPSPTPSPSPSTTPVPSGPSLPPITFPPSATPTARPTPSASASPSPTAT